VAVFGVDEVRAEPQLARYNVAPGQQVLAVAVSHGHEEGKGPRRQLGTLRWGLVPSWAKDPSVGNRMINARAEGIAAKPAYRAALVRRRCLIPADAFYEWQVPPGRDGPRGPKVPHAIRRRDGAPMALGGLWELWRDRGDPDAPPLRTCVVVTTAANELLAPIHDRMPVVLDPGSWERWLDPATGPDGALDLLRPAPSGWFETFALSSAVNRVGNDGPDLLTPLAAGAGPDSSAASASPSRPSEPSSASASTGGSAVQVVSAGEGLGDGRGYTRAVQAELGQD